MTVEQEAAAAARAAYPDADVVLVRNGGGEPMVIGIAGNKLHAMARTPYAQGYRAGYGAALESLSTEHTVNVMREDWDRLKRIAAAALR